jgi:hypothetical protein
MIQFHSQIFIHHRGSFLTWKCEPLGGIVPSHILNLDWLLHCNISNDSSFGKYSQLKLCVILNLLKISIMYISNWNNRIGFHNIFSFCHYYDIVKEGITSSKLSTVLKSKFEFKKKNTGPNQSLEFIFIYF